MNMKHNRRGWILAITVILLFLLTACQNTNETSSTELTNDVTTESETENSATSTEATTEAYEPFYVEDLELTKLDGSKTTLYAYEGQTIVLNFWATWCTYCVQEMPLLDEMDKRDDIKVIAISVGEDAETVRKYIEDAGYEFEVFLDEEGTLAGKFGVTGFPTSLFIGTDFEYFYTFPGMLEQSTFDSVLEAIDEIIEGRKSE